MRKQPTPRRPERGDEFVLLVDSPHWPAGSVLQFVIKEYWYGHEPIEEFIEDCKRDNCTVLHMERVEDRPHGSRYLTDEEVEQRLKAKGLWNETRAQRQAEYAEEQRRFNEKVAEIKRLKEATR
jgi:hypothetical protein